MINPVVKIPFNDLQASNRLIYDELLQAYENVLKSGQFILGQEVDAFEREFAAFCGARYSVGVGSGTEALHLALLALGVGQGDEIITVSHTFIATALAIYWAGAKPVFVDIDRETYTLDPSKLAKACTNKTKAIVVVHLYGHPANMDPVLEFAQSRGLKVVEDAAQAHGAYYKGRRIGSIGDVTCFSFYPSKNLGGLGDGGAVVTNNEEVAKKVRELRHCGRSGRYVHDVKGVNSRLDEIQAAVLRIKLRHLDHWNEKRRRLANQYEVNLNGIPNLILVKEKAWAKAVYHLYVVLHRKREQLQGFLARRGIETLVHYPIPIHQQKAFSDSCPPNGFLPNTEEVASTCLSLPMYSEMTLVMLDSVSECIKSF